MIAQQTPRGEDDQVGLGEGFSDFTRLSVGLFLLEGVDQFDRGEALLHKAGDSRRESNMVAMMHEQTDPADLQDNELGLVQ